MKRSTNEPVGPAAVGAAVPKVPLALRVATEVALRVTPGRRVLLLAPPSPWLVRAIERRAASLEVTPLPGEGDALDTQAATYHTIVALRVLPFLGEEGAASERRAQRLVAAMAEKLDAGGHLVVDIDNPQSLRGAFFGVRHLAKAMESGPLVARTPEGCNRFDTLERFVAHLPGFLELADIVGAEFLFGTAADQIPGVGRIVRAVEWRAGTVPLLRRFAGHLVLLLRHAGGRPADRNRPPSH